jgi:nitrogen regulatory protein PII
MLGLGTVDKDVIMSLLPRREVKMHLAGLAGLLKLKRPGKGIAFSIPLGALNGLVANIIETAFEREEEQEEKETGKPMTPKFSLIVTVVETGFVDAVMESAKSAGATGGTLVHARGIGRQEGDMESIMGASLQTEKEIVVILAERTMHKEIMEAINKDCGILTEAKGVVFSLPVDELVGIGN